MWPFYKQFQGRSKFIYLTVTIKSRYFTHFSKTWKVSHVFKCFCFDLLKAGKFKCASSTKRLILDSMIIFVKINVKNILKCTKILKKNDANSLIGNEIHYKVSKIGYFGSISNNFSFQIILNAFTLDLRHGFITIFFQSLVCFILKISAKFICWKFSLRLSRI